MTDTPLDPDDLPLAYRQGSAIEGLGPIVGFIAGEQLGGRFFGELWGDRLAIILMTLAAVYSVYSRHKRGKGIGWWIPSVAVYLFFRGIAGLIWGEDVFLAIGIGLKAFLGIAAVVSVVIGRAAAGLLAPMVLPFDDETKAHAVFKKTMRNLTLAYALYQLITVGIEIRVLQETDSGSSFLIIRTIAGMVAGFIGMFVAIFYTDRQLKKIPGFGGVMEMFEKVGLALEQRQKSSNL